jgi:hypothetical protein
MLLLVTRPASAQPDYRPSDRIFFGVGGGSAGLLGPSPEGAHAELVLEVSWWPNDFFGLMTDAHLSGFADDWGVTPVGALPLRYVQLYGGAFLGFRNEHEAATGRPPRGVDRHAHLVMGMNGYVSRNLRVFVQWEDPPVARLGAVHRQAVIGGFRWSPDAWHQARPTNKIDFVVWMIDVVFLSWMVASVAQ